MLLNQYLPRDELEKTLKIEEFQSLEIILKHLPHGEKINSIFSELNLLAQIHNSINLEKYLKKDFRKSLFESSLGNISTQWDKYFEICGIDKKISDMNEIERKNIIKKFIEFNWSDNEETKRFVEFFGYPNYMIPDKTNELKNEIIISNGSIISEPLKSLLCFQTPIVCKSIKKLENLNARFLIQMPTGTGKTRTATEIISHIFNQNKNIQIIWFANKSELLEQARESFIQHWNHVGKYPIKIIIAWGNKPIPKIPVGNVIIFANYQKMNNFLAGGKKLKPHYIIVDEAHQILAPTYNKALNQLTNFENSTRVIGLTATPGRGIDEQQNKLLVSEFQSNIIQIELDQDDQKIYEKNIVQYLEDQEILAQVNFKPLKTDYEYKLSENEWNKLTRLVQGDHPEYSKEFLKQLANDNTRNMLIIYELKKYADEGKKCLYFSTSQSQSIIIFAALQKLGVNAVHIDDDTEYRFRRQIVKKFRDTNEISIICNYGIFTAGFDVPNLDVVFVGRPINSPVTYNQIVGRGTRGLKMGGGEKFTLVQVIDKIKFQFGNFDPYTQYRIWDQNWKDE